MTISNNDLQAVDFSTLDSFQINLAEESVLWADKIIRLIPKKRMVVLGRWQNKSVVAKLFFDEKRAKRHSERDVRGIRVLTENKIPTPTLYYQGMSADKRTYVLIFERMIESNNLEDIWKNRKTLEEIRPALQAMMIELATQHVLGVLQKDLHLKNFLVTEKSIYTLDGADIELFHYILPKKMSLDNLALFLSQFGVGLNHEQEKLFQYYATARGWAIKKEDRDELFFAISKWNEFRWKRFEKKIFRTSSHFDVIRDWRTKGVFDRHYVGPEWTCFLKNPDAIFHDSSATLLKAGRSTTVIKVKLDDHEVVIKRYNIKNFFHHLRRGFRFSRAHESWRLAQKLILFGIQTAKPIAFLDKKFLGFQGKSYYVTEYIAGEHVGEFFSKYIAQPEKSEIMVKRVVMLLKNLAKLEVTHGDLKMTNILINANEEPTLIDLDGAREHASLSSLRTAWRKEIKRLMKNFQDQKEIQEKIKEALKR